MLLTNAIRAKIVDAAIEKSDLPKLRKKVQQGLLALAKLVYATEVQVPAEIKALSADVKSKWLRNTSSIEIYTPGFDRYSYWSKGREDGGRNRLNSTLGLEDPVYLPIHFGTVNLKDKPKLKQAATSVHADHLAANQYEDDLRQKLNAIVSTANTDEQLLKTWPEGKKFIPAPVAKSRALVDTKTIADVNTTLGLK